MHPNPIIECLIFTGALFAASIIIAVATCIIDRFGSEETQDWWHSEDRL